MEPRIRYTKIREVVEPRRAHEGDAGYDFYLPSNLTPNDLRMANKDTSDIRMLGRSTGVGCFGVSTNGDGYVNEIILGPQSRIRIPSGIKVLLEPKASMLKAANKSGISSNLGLIYTAEIVDSPYTGEMHICIMNPFSTSVVIDSRFFSDKKAITQFIHIPVFLSEPEEIDNETYNEISKDWGDRGEDAFSSTDKTEKDETE